HSGALHSPPLKAQTRLVNQERTLPSKSNEIRTSYFMWWNFIPIFLFDTFRKMANVYFLVIGLLQTIPPISPTNGVPLQFLPLSIVVIIDGIFAAIEDYHRHRADHAINVTLCQQYNVSKRAFETLAWKDLEVGDLVQLNDNEVAPADLVVLAAEGQVAGCYVETKSLDGETNLKLRETLLQDMLSVPEPDIGNFLTGLRFEHDAPTPNIHDHRGTVLCSAPGTPRPRPSSSVQYLVASHQAKAIHAFFTHLALSHCVMIDANHAFAASSPDDLALVRAAKLFGFVFAERTRGSILLHLPKGGRTEEYWHQKDKNTLADLRERRRYHVLAVFEFTSARKRMSVVVKANGADDYVHVLCKGADSMLRPRLRNDAWIDATQTQLQSFASEGLRTLVIGKAMSTRLLRGSLLEASRLQDAMEQDLTLLGMASRSCRLLFIEAVGATGIEDRLQEGVKEALHLLGKAGMAVWILTGDMEETAMNVAFGCSLLTNDVERFGPRGSRLQLPLETGRQAANSSDFAIGQFRFLARLVLVHGRWNYNRIATLILFTYYKNIVYCMSLFWYMLAPSAYSGTLVYAVFIQQGCVRPCYDHLNICRDYTRMEQGSPVQAKPRPRWNTEFVQFVLATDAVVYENERYQPFVGFGHSFPGHLLPSDRGHWSDASGGVSTNQAIPTALLRVDTGGAQSDDDGWEYAMDFTQFPTTTCHRRLAFVRRRRWVLRAPRSFDSA
ncbi:hypothetical protein DYB32_008576, partial [Aphanomyces invadans]